MKMKNFAIGAVFLLALIATAQAFQTTVQATVVNQNKIAATGYAYISKYGDYWHAFWYLDGAKVAEQCWPGDCHGDAAAGVYQSPSLSPGTHMVSYRVVTRSNGESVGSAVVTIQAPPQPENRAPIAQFNSNCNGLTCYFNDMSRDDDGMITNWNWDFGDGYTSPAQNPQHTYASNGTYLVTLQVTDDDGAASTTTGNVVVTAPAQPPANLPPVAYFTYTNSTPNTFSFIDASTDSDGAVVSWLWNFADGTTSAARNPTHVFAAGTYSVVLTVTDDDGATNSYARTITVSSGTSTTNRPPASVFTVSVSGATASFTDESYDSDGTITTWYWTFGDGATSTVRNPTHVYTAIGSYNVTLTVTDNGGLTHSSNRTITITSLNRAPYANAGIDATTNTTTDLAFIGTGTDYDGTIVLYEWDFDYNSSKGFEADWSSASTGVTTHRYTRAGTYYAYLRVTDNEGAKSTDIRVVTVTGENVSDEDTTGRITYDFHLYGADVLRTYNYDIDEDTTTIKLKITNMEDTERNFLIRDVIPKEFAEDIDDFHAYPSYDKLYNRDPEMGWNVTLKPYETFTITYVFDGFKSLNDTKKYFAAPRLTEIKEIKPAQPEEQQEAPEQQDALSALTGNVLGAFSDPQYGFIYLIVVVVLVLAFWKREYIVKKWKSFTEGTEDDEE
ncbi:MAG: PKD domain-containing protein [archaeon]